MNHRPVCVTGVRVCVRVRGAPRNGFSPTAIGAPGIAVCSPASPAAIAACGPADDTVVVHGNRRVDAAAIRGHFHASPDGRLDAVRGQRGAEDALRVGLFEDVKVAWSGSRLIVTVVEAPVIDRVQFEGNKQLKDKDLAGEIRSRTHAPLTKAAVQDDVARLAGHLSEHRPLRRDRSRRRRSPRAKAVPISCSRSRRVRRPELPEDRLHRQPRLFRPVAQGRHQDQRVRLVRVPQDHRCLRPRPHRIRPRPAAHLLPQERLCRHPDRRRDGRLRSDAERLHRHLHRGRRRPLPARHHRYPVAHRRGRRVGPARAN